MTKCLNISTDNTLGGSSASDAIVASQKAVKEYVDSKTGGGSYHPDLFDHKWSDYELSDMNWLRADTFSWHNGGTDEPYDNAYQHLVDDVSAGVTTTFYAWHSNYGYGTIYTLTQTPVAESDYYYRYQNGEMVRMTLVDAVAADYSFISDASVNSYDRNSAEDVQVAISLPQTETIAGITITYYSSADGHKIVLADQETNVESIYSATGVAWYYILDTTNQRFKLPRTKFAETGLRDTVGNYVPAGVPNITATFTSDNRSGTDYHSSATGAITDTVKRQWTFGGGTANSTSYTRSFDASLASSVYNDSTTVQPPATQMYLYFYVGAFTQSALENTAGLNAELFNEKADVDLTNAVSSASATAKAAIVSWGMPDYNSGVTQSTWPFQASNYCLIHVILIRTRDNSITMTLNGVTKTIWNGQATYNAYNEVIDLMMSPGDTLTFNYSPSSAVVFPLKGA